MTAAKGSHSNMSYDIHIEGVPQDEVTRGQCLTFGKYARSLGIQGIQKMVNRFTKCMMTPIGTDLSDPDYGTPLAAAFLNSATDATVSAVAAQSVVMAETKVREYDSSYELPDDERLLSAKITAIVADPTGLGVTLYIELKSVSGAIVTIPMSSYLGT